MPHAVQRRTRPPGGRLALILLASSALVAPLVAVTTAVASPPEGCVAGGVVAAGSGSRSTSTDPNQPASCSYDASVAGLIAGEGTWSVDINRAGAILHITSSDAAANAACLPPPAGSGLAVVCGPGTIVPNDSVTAVAEVGSAVIVGDPAPIDIGGGAATPISGSVPHDLGFAPATIVDPTLFGPEPGLTVERPLPTCPATPVAGCSQPGAVDANRVFVANPSKSSEGMAMLHRSTNGGRSFRLLVNADCPALNKPVCLTGGSDATTAVSAYDGTTDYAFGGPVVEGETVLASSTDHGDHFPMSRTNPAAGSPAGSDRPWIVALDTRRYPASSGHPLQAVMTWQQEPSFGLWVEGIDDQGQVVPPPASQLHVQSASGLGGPPVADTTGGPGNGYLYVPYNDMNGPEIAVAPLAHFDQPADWHIHPVSKERTPPAALMLWAALDSHGNLYEAWQAGTGVYYASSLIDDPANDPHQGGSPGTSWSSIHQIMPPGMGSAAYASMVAGDPGRIAIAYMATPDASGSSTDVAATARWYTVVSESTNALSSSPTFTSGSVGGRVRHTGPIAEDGESHDRSLLDFIDIAVDAQGAVAVTTMDNNNPLADGTEIDGDKGAPFALYSKLSRGPSLWANHPPIRTGTLPGWTAAASGDATWPAAGGTNLPSLDLLNARLALDAQGNLVGSIRVGDATNAGMLRDLAAYNAATPRAPAQRIQYVLRFDTDTDVDYLAMDVDLSSAITFHGGRLGVANALPPTNPQVYITSGTAEGAKYDEPAGVGGVPVSGHIDGDTITFTAQAAGFGLSPTSAIYSATAFAMAGPAAAAQSVVNPMRTVDATPPFDGMSRD